MSTTFIPVRRPLLSPRNSFVRIAQCRSPPSSWEDDVINTIGQRGHGLAASFLFSGGFANNSICVTDFAPCLTDVPTQSEPVSPPPITSTFLLVARISP